MTAKNTVKKNVNPNRTAPGKAGSVRTGSSENRSVRPEKVILGMADRLISESSGKDAQVIRSGEQVFREQMAYYEKRLDALNAEKGACTDPEHQAAIDRELHHLDSQVSSGGESTRSWLSQERHGQSVDLVCTCAFLAGAFTVGPLNLPGSDKLMKIAFKPLIGLK